MNTKVCYYTCVHELSCRYLTEEDEEEDDDELAAEISKNGTNASGGNGKNISGGTDGCCVEREAEVRDFISKCASALVACAPGKAAVYCGGDVRCYQVNIQYSSRILSVKSVFQPTRNKSRILGFNLLYLLS